jgi:hypothetical protein
LFTQRIAKFLARIFKKRFDPLIATLKKCFADRILFILRATFSPKTKDAKYVILVRPRYCGSEKRFKPHETQYNEH